MKKFICRIYELTTQKSCWLCGFWTDKGICPKCGADLK